MNITKLFIALMALTTLSACGDGDGAGVTANGGGASSTATIYSAQAYLKAANASASSFFGNSIAISGDTVVVGALNEGSAASQAGAAYVLRRTGTTWVQEAFLTASNPGAADNFGYSVAISGDTIVVGAICESSSLRTIINAGSAFTDDDDAGCAGAAYVFKRTGTNWSQEAYLKASNAGVQDPNWAPGDDPLFRYITPIYYGWSVAVSGNTVVVGALSELSNQTSITNGNGPASLDSSAVGAGAAFVYQRSGATWAQQAYIKAPNANSQDSFGSSLALSGDTVVVGASNEESNQTTITNGLTASANNSATGSGAAYVFKRTGVNWAPQAYLKAPNAEAGDQFGYSVAIDVDTVVVGALTEASNQTTISNAVTASNNNAAAAAGAAYVFKRTGIHWVHEAYLKASNANAGDRFGASVGVYGDTVVIGAMNESSSQNTLADGTALNSDQLAPFSGSAYVFKRIGSTWAQEAYLKAPNADVGDQFGTSVAIDGNTVVVGALWERSAQASITNGATASADNSLSGVGAAYVFLHR
jgi:hypothetical protein